MIARTHLVFLFLFFFYLAETVWAQLPLVPTRKVKAAGVDIAVYESSGTQGPGILLIHGNTSSANVFAQIMNSPFARQYKVVAMDLPGYGKSENFLIYTAHKIRTAIRDVAIATKVDAGILVGWSWGGDLALQASTVLPSLKGLFIFGTAPIGGAPSGSPSPLLTPFESPAGLATLYGAIPILMPRHIRAYVNAFFQTGYSPIPETFYKDGDRTHKLTRAHIALVGMGMDKTFRPEVSIAKNLRIPLAMVHMENDSFVRLAYLRAIERSFPTLWTGQTLVVPDTGHALQWERPDIFENLLTQFMDDLR